MNKQNIFSPQTRSSTPILVVRNITKKFPGVIALDKISFEVFPNSIHALLGENGAGKSTLVKILYGIYAPDEGEIFIDNKKIIITSPRDAIRHGIVMVSQSPVLIEKLTIAENIILSLKKYGLFSSIYKAYDEIIETLQKIGLNLDPNTEVYKLTYTQKQLVEIARALLLGVKILILDEATTYLPESEKMKIFRFFRNFVKENRSIILITHKLIEALKISDYITVLRRGKVVATLERDKASIDLVRKYMFGEARYTYTGIRGFSEKEIERDIVLSIKDLWVKGDLGDYRVKGVSIEISRGEIVGIAGITGNGQLELFEAIMGLRKISRGRIVLKGIDITNKSTRFIRRLGVGYIPDNPLRYGLSTEHTLVENIALSPSYDQFLIPWSRISRDAEKLVGEYGIVTTSIYAPIKLLSGGNLMKTLVSREIEYASTILIAYNPTRGLDEYTAFKVRKTVYEKSRSNGLTVFFASEDLDEVLELSDRVVVMNSGRFVGVFSRKEVVREKIEELMVM